jgi:hypothetical protein
MSTNMEKIRKVKKMHENDWLSIDDVVAVGIGLVSGGNVGIVISVSRNLEKVREKIPASIEGFPIELKETGEIVAF